VAKGPPAHDDFSTRLLHCTTCALCSRCQQVVYLPLEKPTPQSKWKLELLMFWLSVRTMLFTIIIVVKKFSLFFDDLHRILQLMWNSWYYSANRFTFGFESCGNVRNNSDSEGIRFLDFFFKTSRLFTDLCCFLHSVKWILGVYIEKTYFLV